MLDSIKVFIFSPLNWKTVSARITGKEYFLRKKRGISICVYICMCEFAGVCTQLLNRSEGDS